MLPHDPIPGFRAFLRPSDRPVLEFLRYLWGFLNRIDFLFCSAQPELISITHNQRSPKRFGMSEPGPRTECWHLVYTAHPPPKCGKALLAQRSPVQPLAFPLCGNIEGREKKPIVPAAGPGPGGAKSRSRVKHGGGLESETEAKDARIQWPNRIGRNKRREAGQSRMGREGAALQAPVSSWYLDALLNAQDPCHWHLPAFVRAAEPHPL